MKTIRDAVPDPGGTLADEEIGRTMRAYSIFARITNGSPLKEQSLAGFAAHLSGGEPVSVPASFMAAFVKAGGPGSWRAAAQVLGALHAHSADGLEAFERDVEAARLYVPTENWDEFQQVAHDCAILEALRAWQWLPRERWSNAHERFPWLALAHEWLARRTPEALAELDDYAAYCLGELCESANHDVLRKNAFSDDSDDDGVPEARRGRVVELSREHLSKVRNALVLAKSTAEISTIDDAFLPVLEGIAPEGKRLATKIRADLPSLIAEYGTPSYGWLPSTNPVSPPRRLETLAVAIWRDVVKPEDERSRTHRPAIVRAAVHDRILPAMTGQMYLPGCDDGTVRDGKGRVIGRISLTTDTTLEAVRDGARALGTVTGHRLIRALVHRSHDAWNRGEQDPRRVAFVGGWEGLLEAIGSSPKQHRLVKDIAIAGESIAWETPHLKRDKFWQWNERRGTSAARGEVAFILGDALTPGLAFDMARPDGKRSAGSLPARIARRLVPELRFEPPMGGARERDHGPIWTWHRLMLVELVDHAEELAKDGSVVITQARWRELAKAAGVATSTVDRTLDAWVAGESEKAPALLERVAKDAWTLARPHELEREFVTAAGVKRTEGRRRARSAKGHPGRKRK